MKRFYDYRCPKCENVITVYLDIDKESSPHCEKCNEKMNKLMSPVPIKFIGPGFYCNEKDKF